MIIVSYDISNDKKRRHFQKFIERLLSNIITQIENKFSTEFDESDSVYVFQLSSSCKTLKYGFCKHEDDDLFVIE